MSWRPTRATSRILGMKDKRLKAVFGGASAGKTWSIIPILIDKAIKNKNEVITIVSDTARNLRDGAMRDFIQIMKSMDRWDRNRWNKTESKYEFAGGSIIEFLGADDETKFRGPRRDRLYINEANRMTFEVYNQLDARTRKEVYLDWNPSAPFWYEMELRDSVDHASLRLTYLDNESLTDMEKGEFERKRILSETSDYWHNWWRVYGLGLTGQIEGACIKDYKRCNIEEDGTFIATDFKGNKTHLQGYKLVGVGMDFGVNDPNTAIALYKCENSYIFDEIFYKPKMYLTDMKRELNRYLKKRVVPIYADYSWKQNLLELNKMGMNNVRPCKKGLIDDRIRAINERDVYVTERSENLLNEFQTYRYKIDKNGIKIDGKYEGNDHACDAAGYVLIKNIKRRQTKVIQF